MCNTSNALRPFTKWYTRHRRFTQTSDVTRLFRMWVGCPEDDHTSKGLEYHPYSALQILAEMQKKTHTFESTKENYDIK